MIYKLNENNYGGAYDIEDDMFFTREEINEFGEDIVEEFNNLTGDNAYLGDIYFGDKFQDTNGLYIEVEDDYSMYDTKVRIDMRKIRLPRDIYKYKNIILKELIKQYNLYNELTESIDNEYDTNNIWTAVCSGDLDKVKAYVTDYEAANQRYNRFGKNHSLIMGAARNGEVEVVDYLLEIGGTIEPHETFEFAKYVKENSNRLIY